MMPALSTIFISLLLSPYAWCDQTIRVLLDEKIKSIELYSQYPIQIQSPHKENISLNNGKSTLKIHRHQNQWQVTIAAHGKQEHFYLTGQKLRLRSTNFKWQKNRIDFPVEIVETPSGLLFLGVMTLNRYLQGVVPHEMPVSWPLEALKAQSIASRTYALWKIKTSHHMYYDIRPSVLDQVFRLDRYGASASVLPKVIEALSTTEGMYLGNTQNDIIKAYFHSDCGGGTESATAIWGEGRRETASVQDRACGKRRSNWKSAWSQTYLQRKINTAYFLPAGVELQDIIVRNQLQSQRVEFVDLLFSKGIFKRIRGEDLRRLLGYDKVKSTLFQITRSATGWVFSGRGFGHGVGMCQWGAREMANSGKSFRIILAHYYPGTEVKSSQPKPDVAKTNAISAATTL
ncbi:MAG: SpoIID/LytB domain-containing protein [Bdellovibrionaceae bacterium]|nr:SpoIID/LytB domain-containing protein [Pseudobdellovibrionaceae bacterium]